MSTRKVSPRKATLLVGVLLATTTLSSPALAAVQSLSFATAAAAPTTTVVSRLSLATGPKAGGTKILVTGTNLATAATANSVTNFTAKAVKFGASTVDASDVVALSASALEVEVPAGGATPKVPVVVGDATKGPIYTYVSPDITVATDQSDLDDLDPSSDTGLAGVEIDGTDFASTTTVRIGGKAAKASVTATKLTVALPAGLTGVQDVVVDDPRNAVYVGHVEYSTDTPTLTAVSSYAVVEKPTQVTLTGTNLDAVTGVSFEGGKAEKLTFARTTDATKLVVTVPKGAAKSGTVKVSTAFGKTATVALERKASQTPTVSAVSDGLAGGGAVTLTGTNLIGLSSVTVTSATAKASAGQVVKVSDATTATVTLPKLAAGTYGLVVKTSAAAGSVSRSFTIVNDTPTVSAAAADSAKTTVTLTGTYLKSATQVVLTPTTGTKITRKTGLTADQEGTSLEVVLPALANGTYGVVVTTRAGVSTSFALVVANPAPEPEPEEPAGP